MSVNEPGPNERASDRDSSSTTPLGDRVEATAKAANTWVRDRALPAIEAVISMIVRFVRGDLVPFVRRATRPTVRWIRDDALPAAERAADRVRTVWLPRARRQTRAAWAATTETVATWADGEDSAHDAPAHRRAWSRVRRSVGNAGVWLTGTALPRLFRRAREIDEAMQARSRADAATPRDPRRSATRLGALVVVLTMIAGLAALPGVLAVDQTIALVGEALLDIDPLPDEFEPLDQRSRVVAADGSVIAILSGPENRITVTLDEIPQVTRDAVIATEDSRFYEHEGINHRAMVRAMVANVADQAVSQGGSTITQQYVKNALLTPEQTIQRKLQEAVYATRLERELSKDEILERYLNITYFGNGVYGIGTAAEFYFNKDVSELDAAESAVLAGMIRAPELNDPIDNPVDARRRRNIVLDQMQAYGALTEAEARTARMTPLSLEVTPLPPPSHPFFVEYVKKQLLDDPRLGETRGERAALVFGGGLEIRTTLRPAAQVAAEAAIAGKLQNPGVDPLGGIISLEPQTGAVLTMAVGPKAFGVCEDPAPEEAEAEAEAVGEGEGGAEGEPAPEPAPCTTTKVIPLAPGLGGSGRQAGSTFKPILDTAALDAGIPTSWHTDTRSGTAIPECGKPGEPWTPVNYDGGSAGVLDMPEGIRQSNNVFHAKLIAEIGPQKVVDMAQRLGVDGDLQPFCSLGLGAQEVFPIDMAQAFGTLANEGVRCEPFAVTEVVGRDGDVLALNEPACERVLDAKVARTMTTMLRRVVTSGTARAANIGRPVAGKTGTTNDFVDAWFVGYIPQMVTAAWMGHESPRCPEGESVGCGPMRGILGYRSIAGGTIPAQMWADFMRVATHDLEVAPLPSERLARYTPPPPPKPDPEPNDDGNADRDEDRKKRKKNDD